MAVDLGGHSVRAAGPVRAVGDPARRPVAAGDSREVVLAALVAVVTEAVGDGAAHDVCVAVPSFVMADGALGPIPSLPALEGVRLDAELAQRVGARAVSVVPDLSAATVGESRLGAGRGCLRFVCVAVGTGVNAGAVVDGRLVETAFGSLGDAGHVLVDPAGPACPCGGVGCLEAVCSGFALARDGAPLGLGVAAAGDRLLDPAREELRRVGPPYVADRIRVVPAELGASATLAGAALLAGR